MADTTIPNLGATDRAALMEAVHEAENDFFVADPRFGAGDGDSLIAALAAAEAASGGMVSVSADISTTTGITVPNNVILELNGYTLDFTGLAGVSVDVKPGGIVRNGVIRNETNDDAVVGLRFYSNGDSDRIWNAAENPQGARGIRIDMFGLKGAGMQFRSDGQAVMAEKAAIQWMRAWDITINGAEDGIQFQINHDSGDAEVAYINSIFVEAIVYGCVNGVNCIVTGDGSDGAIRGSDLLVTLQTNSSWDRALITSPKFQRNRVYLKVWDWPTAERWAMELLGEESGIQQRNLFEFIGFNLDGTPSSSTESRISRLVQLPYTSGTGDFTVGLTVTGGTSGATGVVVSTGSTASGDLYLTQVEGQFENGETITDTSTGSADAGDWRYRQSDVINGRITQPRKPSLWATKGEVVIYNSHPTPGADSGWVPVDTGTPATWESIGKIDSGGILNVKSFGATGDGTTDDTAAIQAAIDAANTAGGGTVVVPPGTFDFATGIDVKKNVELRLSHGTVLEYTGTGTYAVDLYPQAKITGGKIYASNGSFTGDVIRLYSTDSTRRWERNDWDCGVRDCFVEGPAAGSGTGLHLYANNTATGSSNYAYIEWTVHKNLVFYNLEYAVRCEANETSGGIGFINSNSFVNVRVDNTDYGYVTEFGGTGQAQIAANTCHDWHFQAGSESKRAILLREYSVRNFFTNWNIWDWTASVVGDGLGLDKLIAVEFASWASATASESNFFQGRAESTTRATQIHKLNVDAVTQDFAIGETVTGGTSGTQGIVVAAEGSGPQTVIYLTQCDGFYLNNETLTGDGSPAGGADADGDSFLRAKDTIQLVGAVPDYNFVIGGSGSAGPGNQYVTMEIGGKTYKLLHDGTV